MRFLLGTRVRKICIGARFLNNVTDKTELSNRSKKKQQLAGQPLLFFFSSFLSLRSLYFPFPCFFLGGFSGSFCLRLLVFFLSQKTAIFVRYVLKNPARYCFAIYQFHFFEAFRFLLVKSEWRGGEDS